MAEAISGSESAPSHPDGATGRPGRSIRTREKTLIAIASTATSTILSLVLTSVLSDVILHVPLLVIALCLVVAAEVAGGVALVRHRAGKPATLPRTPLALLVAGAVLGAVLGWVIAHPATPLSITTPAATIRCTSPAPQCRFQVTGRATPEPGSDQKILVLIYPTSPVGQGWYIQWPQATVQPNGTWFQDPSFIGSGKAAAHNGDTFNIQAVLVSGGGIYAGSTLADVSRRGSAITDVSQISGLVAQSQIVRLTVTRTRPVVAAGWKTVFGDTFSGPAGSGVDSHWTYDIGTHYNGVSCPAGWGTGEVDSAVRSTANVSEDGHGHLLIKPVRAAGGWSSGRIETARTFAAPAGGELKVAASIMQPNPADGRGYWPAFLLLGAGFRAGGAGTSGTMVCPAWPTVGEIDVMEAVNASSDLSGTLHCGLYPHGPCHEPVGLTSGLLPCAGCQTGYHTYSVIVDRAAAGNESITWYLDGTAYLTVDESQVGAGAWQAAVDHGFFLILDVAMGGGYPHGVCHCTAPTASTTSGAAMSVRSVAVSIKSAPV